MASTALVSAASKATLQEHPSKCGPLRYEMLLEMTLLSTSMFDHTSEYAMHAAESS